MKLQLLSQVLLILTGSFSCPSAVTVLQPPMSQNVSVGQQVKFICATADNSTSIMISWHFVPNIGVHTPTTKPRDGGGLISELVFNTSNNTAPNITLGCVINDISTGISNITKVQLLLQGQLAAVGNLTSGEVDHCTLHFTWTAPYTLKGVPIYYYIINITRHSDGRVIEAREKLNTTEYIYTVNSPGEMLDVAVTAVNKVGTGNVATISVMAPSIHDINNTKLFSSNKIPVNTQWTYTFILKDFAFCERVFNPQVTVEACLSSSCVSVTGIMHSADGVRRVMATFSNLEENRKYSASVHVQYNGGVVQQSQPVEITTFDVQNVTLNSPVNNGQVCLDIQYVHGHSVSDQRCFVLVECTRERFNKTINGMSGCVDNLPTNTSCNITATDEDAVDEINTIAAVTILGVSVPGYSPVTTPTSTPTATPTSIAAVTVATNRAAVVILLLIAIIII